MPEHSPRLPSHRQASAGFAPAPTPSLDLDRMPRDLPRAYKAELARGVRDNGAAQANTYIASAYVQGAATGRRAERSGHAQHRSTG